MTIFPFQINKVIHLYNKVSKIKLSVLEQDIKEPQDIKELQGLVNISAEAKRKQILDQTKREVLERIREIK